MAIQRLSPDLINQIAAGEVVERPASVIKELVENALDAHATDITIHMRRAGQSFLSVEDNGCGIAREDLPLALERHATSKLPEKDLFHIRTFGFRGEALPAIAAVSRLTLSSRQAHDTQGWSLNVEGDKIKGPHPIRLPLGTYVEVADLFFTTPARLKFLKSERSEWIAIRYLMEQIALAHPHVSFKIVEGTRTVLNYLSSRDEAPWDSLIRSRLDAILGENFSQDALTLDREKKGYRVRGFLSLPTAHRAQSLHQFFFVNNRPIKDKMLSSLIKIAYHDIVPPGRFPAVVLFLDIPLDAVDVNVHPAKTEVRFADTAFLKEWLLAVLKETLTQKLLPAAHHLGIQAVKAFSGAKSLPSLPISQVPLSEKRQRSFETLHKIDLTPSEPASLIPFPPPLVSQPLPDLDTFPLGHAVGQIHNRYIVAQNDKGFLIIDQHAAHERLIYEKLKEQASTQKGESEALIIPLMIALGKGDQTLFEDVLPVMRHLGFDMSFLGQENLMIRAIPALLKDEVWETLIQDILDTARQTHHEGTVHEDPLTCALNLILSAQACQRRSIKSGRKLSLLEMNQLLRDMEKTPHSAQCNHGRPTYIVLEMQQLDGLFKRA